MQDIESLKLDAEALGIKFRSDIKADTLQAKIDEFNKVNNPSAVAPEKLKPAKTVEPTYLSYKNTSGINVFTEGGRCRPDGTVELTDSEALQYKDLECVK